MAAITDKWIPYLEMEGKSPRTIQQYKWTWDRFANRYPGKRLEDFTATDVCDFLANLPEGSRRSLRAPLSSCFRWAEKHRLIDRNPMDLVPAVGQPRRKPVVLFTEDEVAALCEDPLARLMLLGGLRRSECLALQVTHVDLDGRRLLVVNGKGAKDREVPLSTATCAALDELVSAHDLGPDDYVWATVRKRGRMDCPLPGTSFARWWRELLAQAGVVYRNPHVTRHTCATRMLRAKVPITHISKFLGHASLAVTLDVYGHLDTRDLAEVVEMMDTLD